MKSLKTSWLIVILIVLIVIAGVLLKLSERAAQMQPAGGPQQAMGINGSPNQGNMGQSDNGTVQQPMADGQEDAVIGSNLALGVNSTTKLGKFLSGYTGMTVYTYDKDTGSTSSCYDTCATNWPPYIVSPVDNIQQLQAGVTGTVATTVRADGQLQLIYNGHPLYFYAKDSASADATGDGVGGVWHIVKL